MIENKKWMTQWQVAGLTMGDEYIGAEEEERSVEDIDEQIEKLMREKETLIQNQKLNEEQYKLNENIKNLQEESLDNLLNESIKTTKKLDL